ncbi:MAG: DNA polymerase III subunit chi [Gammaproteobacteria bacterium]|nr:DNA polymerase III subunit chi [Gammaproteobacteria bacterium]NNF60276.1 DNA polymerase III subunit chi [Gammaproteobacteria bacterium]NNM20384.1 DNA polymerase III subunit chi [Gammaproteobacteria bacterium]
MTRVDFYILDDDSGDGLQRFACRLVDKAWGRGMRCFINTATPDQAARLDELLWTFRDISFLPHAIAPAAESARLAALIGNDSEPDTELDLLINLSPEVPTWFSRFERVAELVDNHDDRRKAGRERFRFYRDRGYQLESHNIR